MSVVYSTAAASAPSGEDARTRDRVLRHVSSRGPVTAAAIAEAFGLTVPGVRRHLDALHEAGYVEVRTTPSATGRRGRPARSYVITSSGHGQLGSSAGEVATEALRFLSAALGDDAVAQFARERWREREETYAAQLADVGDDPAARAHVLAQALAADGFAASARPAGVSTGVQLCQGHCPVQPVAAEFPQLCEAESESFARLLGVRVQRLATLAGGDHVCTTFVPSAPDPHHEDPTKETP